jgi:signal transduction histidine kinase
VGKSNLGGVVLLAGALLVLLSTIFLYRSDQAEYAALTARSDRLKDITDQTEDALSDLKDAETGQRGYLLTGKTSYLEPYREGVSRYGTSAATLKSLTRGEGFAPVADALLAAGAGKIRELERVVGIYASGDHARAIATVNEGVGKALMDQARELSARLIATSDAAFAANNRAVGISVERSRTQLFFAAGLLFCLTLGGAILLTYEVRRETALARGLEASEKRYRELALSLEEQVADRTRHLETVNKALDAFSYSVSHDLRAPLRSIDGFSVMVVEDYADRLDDAGRDMLNRIRAAALRMGRLIQSLLDMARLTTGEAHPERLSLSDLAKSIVEDLRAGAPERACEVRIEPGLTATSDPVLVRLILENLLSNAWKFSARTDAAAIEVGSTEAAGRRAFFVRDNGAGFEPELAGRLFTPFQRLHASAEFDGTGIGLATVHRAVVRMGGKIWAEGKPGKGAVFYFTLD